MVMRLMGTRTIGEIGRECVITKDLPMHVEPNPRNYLPHKNYEPMVPLGSKL